VVLEQAKEYLVALLAKEKSGISHIGIGTGVPTATGLGTEVGRRATKEATTPLTKQRLWEAYFEDSYPATDCSIKEAGLIGHVGTVYVAATSITTLVKRSGIDSLIVKYKLFYP
jgi:hypothetical protein